MNYNEDCKKYPVYHIALCTLFAIAGASLPVEKLFALFITGDATLCFFLSNTVLRLVLSFIAVLFIRKYRFNKVFSVFNRKGLATIICGGIIAVNNFPIIGLLGGNVRITASDRDLLLFVCYCVSIGLFEELSFRAIVFPIVAGIFGDKKHGLFLSVLVSSAVFGMAHIVNVLSGAGVLSTVLQVGYSFLLGGLCATLVVKTENVIPSIIIHSLYDVGGLICDEFGGGIVLAVGDRWDTLTVVMTAVVTVIILIYIAFVLAKGDGKATKRLFFSDENEQFGRTDDVKTV